MKNLLEFLITRLVNHPEEIVVTQEEGYEGQVYKIQVHPEDMGRVIGRKGAIIKAIRKIAQAKAFILGERVSIELVD